MNKMGETKAKIPPITVAFFVLFPTLALACCVAVVASPDPRSWSFFGSMLCSWIALRGAAWFLHKNRDHVAKLEQIETAMESEVGLDVTSDGKTEEHNTAYNHVHLYRIIQTLMRPPSYTSQIQHASALCLIIILAIRMFSFGRFDTHPANLDFGPFPDDLEVGTDNAAFLHRFDSFANVMQGGFAAFLSYPAVIGLIARVFTTAPGDSLLLKKPNVYMIWLCEVLSATMTIFPSAMIVTAIAKEYAIFANSPHLRKISEWLVGYCLGISAGMYFSCIVSRVLLLISGILNALEDNGRNADEAVSYVVEKLAVTIRTTDDEDDNEVVKYGFGKADDYLHVAIRPVEIASRIVTRLCQILLAITTLLNGVFLGATWNYDAEDKTSVGIILINIGVVILVFGAAFFATNKT